jgi:hypothetical protein
VEVPVEALLDVGHVLDGGNGPDGDLLLPVLVRHEVSHDDVLSAAKRNQR